MKLSKAGSDKLIIREGLRLKAYKDTKGILTIGVGHTGPEVVEGLVWTKEKAHAVFMEDVTWAEEAVNNNVYAPLTQNQFDALVSFVFNVGATAFRKSTMLKCINRLDYDAAELQFDRWKFPPEILGRRMSEKKQFTS